MSYKANWLALTGAGAVLIVIDASTWALTAWAACVTTAAAITLAARRHA